MPGPASEIVVVPPTAAAGGATGAAAGVAGVEGHPAAMEGVEAGAGAGAGAQGGWALDEYPGFEPPTTAGVTRQVAYRPVEPEEGDEPEYTKADVVTGFKVVGGWGGRGGGGRGGTRRLWVCSCGAGARAAWGAEQQRVWWRRRGRGRAQRGCDAGWSVGSPPLHPPPSLPNRGGGVMRRRPLRASKSLPAAALSPTTTTPHPRPPLAPHPAPPH